MTMIILLKNFTYAGANGDGFVSDWVQIPEENQNWQLIVEIHGRVSATAGSLRLATSWDSGLTLNPGSSVNLATVGINSQDITTNMGPLIRVAIQSTADSIVTMSVYLTPKMA